ncbi:hypothetical protein [Gordonia polyisoprenivorans]|uniref:hypothetical protein n=1 Tax=Gordonia polyisoprenivorans TaxID=84595 RepID=UPI001AD6F98B|nr:hypothetical protein [Gordonia polyisoprenivorans]QTI69190.1 hypothetical protein J6U32_00650 [Gordonia polyisoprenivorans]
MYDEIVAVKRLDDSALAAEARDEEDDAKPVSASAESSSPPAVGPRVQRKLLPMEDALEQLRAPDQRPPAP